MRFGFRAGWGNREAHVHGASALRSQGRVAKRGKMTSSHADNLGTTIYDEVDYKVMSDVPYELDQHVLVQMQKLERGLSYILDNLRNSDMTLEEVAAHAGYSPGYFKALFVQHFEIPFERFVTKLRMRQAARDICDEHFPLDIAARYGYATPASFSKAFRREIGVSPRQFYKGNYAVPDMPLRSSLDGVSDRMDALRDAAKAYDTFAGKAEGQKGSVRFIYKTEQIG